MRCLAAYGLHDRVRFTADGHCPAEIIRPEGRDGLEQKLPAGFPPGEDRGARIGLAALELRIAIAIRFLTVACEEIRPSRSHVAGHMLDDERNAVRVWVDDRKELAIVDLRHRLVCL